VKLHGCLPIVTNTLVFWLCAMAGARISTDLRWSFWPRSLVGLIFFAGATTCALNLRRELKRFRE
jgi:hypothetical protein